MKLPTPTKIDPTIVFHPKFIPLLLLILLVAPGYRAYSTFPKAVYREVGLRRPISDFDRSQKYARHLLDTCHGLRVKPSTTVFLLSTEDTTRVLSTERFTVLPLGGECSKPPGRDYFLLWEDPTPPDSLVLHLRGGGEVHLRKARR